MVVHETPVSNSANLAMFMVNVSQALMRPMRMDWPELSVNDLKTWFRSRKYVIETLKLLPEMPEPIFIERVIAKVAKGFARLKPQHFQSQLAHDVTQRGAQKLCGTGFCQLVIVGFVADVKVP